MRTVIFKPVAQNTIVRPIAQAISLVRAGKTVTYIDTADKKEKAVGEEDLTWLPLNVENKGRQIPIDANLVTFWAKYGPIQVHVYVNDVVVKVTPKTTVRTAMAQFRRKISKQNQVVNFTTSERQRDL